MCNVYNYKLNEGLPMNISEITQTFTLDDKVEQSLIINTRTGELTRHAKRLAITEISGTGITIGVIFILYFCNISEIFSSLHFVVSASAIFCILLLFNIICIKKRTVKNLKKALTKYYKDNFAQHQLSTYTDKMIIDEDYLECSALGMTTRLEHKDFIGIFETDIFYVFEYAHFNYAFIKKDAIQNDEYQRIVQFIQDRKSIFAKDKEVV